MLHFLRVNWWIPVLAAALVLAVLPFIDPAPPRSIVLATGRPDGAYHALGERLRENLARKGLTLELRATEGSMDNLRLLADSASGVALGLVQSGAEQLLADDTSALRSLGSLFYEPLWIFHRADAPVVRLSDLRGRRIAVGAPGSGTHAVARVVLQESGVAWNPGGAPAADGSTQVPLGGREAAQALREGTVDAVFLVLSPRSELVRELAATPGIALADIRRERAYLAHFPFLAAVTVGEGLLDLEANVPDRDHRLLAPVATLVSGPLFNPALTPLVLEALREELAPGGLLERPGEFPSPRFAGLPLAAEADYYYRKGLPVLQRFLPFWVASLVDRMIILAIPLVALLLPLFRLAGPIYNWRVRARIYRWYRHLRGVEHKLRDGATGAELEGELERLRQIDRDLFRVHVPLSYAQELYQLHLHVDWIIRRLEAGREREAKPAPPPG